MTVGVTEVSLVAWRPDQDQMTRLNGGEDPEREFTPEGRVMAPAAGISLGQRIGGNMGQEGIW